jgi:hypothetical protein
MQLNDVLQYVNFGIEFEFNPDNITDECGSPSRCFECDYDRGSEDCEGCDYEGSDYDDSESGISGAIEYTCNKLCNKVDVSRDSYDRRTRWHVKYDSSIRSNTVDGGVEVTSPVLAYDTASIQQVKDVCRVLRSDCKAQLNKSCGLHIHVSIDEDAPREIASTYYDTLGDSGAKMVKTIQNAARLFIRNEDTMYALSCGGWEAHRGITAGWSFCMPLSRLSNLDSLFRVRTMSQLRNIQGTRYLGLNMQSFWSHNSLEYRLFNMSLDPIRVEEYVKMAVHSIATASFMTLQGEQPKVLNSSYVLGTAEAMKMGETQKRHMIEQFANDVGLRMNDISRSADDGVWCYV